MTDNYGHMQPSHCKTCKELAEDCECKRVPIEEPLIDGEDYHADE